ncbi:hypothetical protein TGMAS_414680, partial [Toxoplasma gondii MAS]
SSDSSVSLSGSPAVRRAQLPQFVGEGAGEGSGRNSRAERRRVEERFSPLWQRRRSPRLSAARGDSAGARALGAVAHVSSRSLDSLHEVASSESSVGLGNSRIWITERGVRHPGALRSLGAAEKANATECPHRSRRVERVLSGQRIRLDALRRHTVQRPYPCLPPLHAAASLPLRRCPTISTRS